MSSIDERLDDNAGFKIEAPKIKHFVQSLQLNVHHFYLFGEIEDDIDRYSDLLNILKTAGEEDTVIIYINSEGGSLRMAVQIVNSMTSSNAKVVTSLDGDAFSAATMIFMAGDEYIINNNCSFMIHNYSAGFVGKGHEVRTRVDHVNVHVEKIMRKFYEKILSEQEFEAVIDGRDIWMDSDELISRLDASETRDAVQMLDTTPESLEESPKVKKNKTAKKASKKKTSKKP